MEKKLLKKIKEYDNIIIAKHTFPDWDAQGSAMGMKEIILDNFNNKNVYIVGDMVNGIEKFINEDLTDVIIKKSLLITVDVANKERVDFDKIDLCKEIFKIDHHLIVDSFGDYELVYENDIACTQVITLWANNLNLKISREAAKWLYFGLITDSNRFMFKNTNTRSFQAAQILIESGIDITEIYDKLYLRSFDVLKWHADAFRKIKIEKDFPIAHIVIEQSDFDSNNLTIEQTKSVLSILSGIKEIEIWFIAYIDPTSMQAKVSLRSRKYNINQIAKLYNGGGHLLASGAKLESLDQIPDLLKSLKSLF